MIHRGGSSPGVRILVWALCAAVWVAAFMATHVPADRLPEMPYVSDKSIHGSGFCILSMFFILALTIEGFRGLKLAVIVMLVMGVCRLR